MKKVLLALAILAAAAFSVPIAAQEAAPALTANQAQPQVTQTALAVCDATKPAKPAPGKGGKGGGGKKKCIDGLATVSFTHGGSARSPEVQAKGKKKTKKKVALRGPGDDDGEGNGPDLRRFKT